MAKGHKVGAVLQGIGIGEGLLAGVIDVNGKLAETAAVVPVADVERLGMEAIRSVFEGAVDRRMVPIVAVSIAIVRIDGRMVVNPLTSRYTQAAAAGLLPS